MKKNKFLIMIFTAAAGFVINTFQAYAAIGVTGDVSVKNQTGIHEGDIYRNYLKADVVFNESFENTEVKVILRGEEDSLRPDEGEENYGYYLRDDRGSKRVYLREAYISHDIYFESYIDSVNIKMGRLIYTWGTSDEVKPVDIINPQDYSNLYFTPIRERKYGVISGAMSVFITENFFIEGVAVPEFRPSEMASSVFVTNQMLEISGNAGLYTLNDPVLPEEKISGSSYAGRAGLTVLDVDMHANYFYGYDKLPVYEMELTAGPGIIITPEYKQIQMIGFDFQRALLWGISVRGEVAYFERGKFFIYDSSSPSGNILLSPLAVDLSNGGNGTVEKDYIEYTAGFDDQNFIFDDLYLNLQFHQKIIRGYEDGLAKEQYTNLVIWNIRYSMVNQKYRVSSHRVYGKDGRQL
ncbi:MAG: hypothetical protein CVV49_20715 [Spirochaetae bacterium HGW-Spirochaetae-5]|nr:MAG: hypothetical protein CVV49_20715 [Spirochaetae bacterium HGW-Spirochaetae-5]